MYVARVRHTVSASRTPTDGEGGVLNVKRLLPVRVPVFDAGRAGAGAAVAEAFPGMTLPTAPAA